MKLLNKFFHWMGQSCRHSSRVKKRDERFIHTNLLGRIKQLYEKEGKAPRHTDFFSGMAALKYAATFPGRSLWLSLNFGTALKEK